MVRLSVNVNKIAVLRNSRGKNQPDLAQAVDTLLTLGVQGITVHPRPDGRHILYSDVRQIGQKLNNLPKVELNVEGFPGAPFLRLLKEVRPDQCTLVPDGPDVLTSNAGWRLQKSFDMLQPVLAFLKQHKIRSSLFVDPFTLTEKELSALIQLRPDRVELYTEEYASAFATTKGEEVLKVYSEAGQKIHAQGIELNAGHDLNLKNLPCLLTRLPQIKEVSIGHALICEALYEGLSVVVKKYLNVCRQAKK